MIKIHVIQTGYFKLDGGAMFGVVPKSMWSKLNQPDENNMCTWSMRCVLLETEDRKILIDTGLGDKQDAKFRSHFYPHGEESLLGSLEHAGFPVESITDVFLTHLHFDHVGGAVKRTSDGQLLPVFPNATYWSHSKHYDWAMNPNPRERASFLKENFVPLKDAGVLKFVDQAFSDGQFLPGFDYRTVFGHTEAMMTPIIESAGRTIVYCADLMPSSGHIGLPYVMGYDIRPLDTLKEKAQLLQDAVDNDYILFFEHDPSMECGTVKVNDRGRYVWDKVGTLEDLLK